MIPIFLGAIFWLLDTDAILGADAGPRNPMIFNGLLIYPQPLHIVKKAGAQSAFFCIASQTFLIVGDYFFAASICPPQSS